MAIGKALAKLPADRFASAAQFSEALVTPGVVTVSETLVTPAAQQKRNTRVLGLAAALVLACVAAVLGWTRSTEPPPLVRFTVQLSGYLPPAFGPGLTIAPDGMALVHGAMGPDGSAMLMHRRIGDLEGTALPGTEDGQMPFFSPDGRSVGYVTLTSQLRVVSVDGGPPLTLGEVVSGGSWGTDGYIYVTSADTAGLARIPATGGDVELIARPDTASSVGAHLWPDALPNGRGVLFTELRTPEQDSDRPSVALMDGIAVKSFGAAEYAVSANGTLLAGGGGGALGLAVVDRSGSEDVFEIAEGSVLYPRLSPDGRKVAYEVPSTTGTDVWVYDLADSTTTRLTFDGQNGYAEWTPDGRHVSFSRSPQGPDRDLWIAPSDGSGSPQLFLDRESFVAEGHWSSDGAWLVLREGDRSRGQDANVLAVPLGAGRDTIVLLDGSFNERAATVSPDGRWVAYVSDESGRDEVYVRPFPNGTGRWQVSAGGGGEPRWAHSGREIFYRASGQLMVAQVRSNPTFAVGSRTTLFPTAAYQVNPNHAAYDVAPDDERFVLVKTASESQQFILALNWFDELKSRAAGSR
jgi:serine/threonine-protein kinase